MMSGSESLLPWLILSIALACVPIYRLASSEYKYGLLMAIFCIATIAIGLRIALANTRLLLIWVAIVMMFGTIGIVVSFVKRDRAK